MIRITKERSKEIKAWLKSKKMPQKALADKAYVYLYNVSGQINGHLNLQDWLVNMMPKHIRQHILADVKANLKERWKL